MIIYLLFFQNNSKTIRLTGGFISFCYFNVSNAILIFKLKIITNTYNTLQVRKEIDSVWWNDHHKSSIKSPSRFFMSSPLEGGGGVFERGGLI